MPLYTPETLPAVPLWANSNPNLTPITGGALSNGAKPGDIIESNQLNYPVNFLSVFSLGLQLGGVPAWSSEIGYTAGSVVSYKDGSVYKFYKVLQDVASGGTPPPTLPLIYQYADLTNWLNGGTMLGNLNLQNWLNLGTGAATPVNTAAAQGISGPGTIILESNQAGDTNVAIVPNVPTVAIVPNVPTTGTSIFTLNTKSNPTDLTAGATVITANPSGGVIVEAKGGGTTSSLTLQSNGHNIVLPGDPATSPTIDGQPFSSLVSFLFWANVQLMQPYNLGSITDGYTAKLINLSSGIATFSVTGNLQGTNRWAQIIAFGPGSMLPISSINNMTIASGTVATITNIALTGGSSSSQQICEFTVPYLSTTIAINSNTSIFFRNLFISSSSDPSATVSFANILSDPGGFNATTVALDIACAKKPTIIQTQPKDLGDSNTAIFSTVDFGPSGLNRRKIQIGRFYLQGYQGSTETKNMSFSIFGISL